MTLNIFGPYGAGINPTTSRPTDVGDPGGADTWFQPCSSPTAGDGTLVSFRWLNKVLASMRRATRGMGIADDPSSDDLLLEAIKRGATLGNIGTGTDIYAGQSAAKAHLLRRLAAGSNISLTLVEGPSGEHAIRIAATAPGSGPTGNTIGNVGDGADVYKGTNSTTEELRGVKGIGPISAAVNGDNIEVGLTGTAYQMLVRNAGTSGEMAGQSISALTAETSPAATDELLLSKVGNAGLRKITVNTLRGSIAPIVAAGSFQLTPDYGGYSVASQNCYGGTVTTVNAAPVYKAVFTFSSALADTRYLVSGGMIGIVRYTDRFEVVVDIDGQLPLSAQFIVFKLP